MKILVVTQYFWPESFRINDLVSGLVERGHAVTVLTGMPNYPAGRFSPGYGALGPFRESFTGAQVYRVPLVPRGKGGRFRLFANYVSFALSASVLGPMMCRGAFDVIFVYEPSPVTVGIPARLLAKITGAPVLFWVQDLWPESLTATGAVKSRSAIKLMEWLVRWIYRGCDRILVQSEAFVEPIRRMGVESERILYFPNSAEDLYRPLPPEMIPEIDRLPPGFRIMFAGNIGAAQSFETVLAAAERLHEYTDIQWLIVGDGRLHPWVKQEVASRGLSNCVHLFGRHPVEAMPRWFAHADVMLVTLRKDPIFSQTVPAKVQSYMACGKPIIAALDGEGARVVCKSGAGLAVPADAAEALAEAILKMRGMDVSTRRSMGARGREYFEANFDRGTLLAKLDAWMKQIVGATGI